MDRKLWVIFTDDNLNLLYVSKNALLSFNIPNSYI